MPTRTWKLHLLSIVAVVSAVTPVTAGPGPDAEQGPPPGWTLVKITEDPEQDRHVAMNNVGQIVFTKRHIPNPNGTQEEVYLYENGKLRQITSNNQAEEGPKINDDGTVVFQRLNHSTGRWHIVRWRDGEEEQLSDPSIGSGFAAIGNTGLIMWSGSPVEETLELFEYRDGVVTQLTNNGLTNRCITINDDEEYAWVRYNFNIEPSWRSTIMASIGGEVLELTDETTQAQSCAITNDDVVGWNDNAGIQLWQDGNITVLPNTENDASGPLLNNVGDVLYDFWTETHWSPFLVRDGVTYQLTDSPDLNNGGVDINDDGEIVLASGDFPEIDIWLVWRARTSGDFTGDGIVGRFDLESMQNCMSNVDCGVQMPPVCLDMFDFDTDGDIDFADFGVFQRLVGGGKA